MKRMVFILWSISIILLALLSGCSTQNNNGDQGNETEENNDVAIENDSRFIGLWRTNPVDNNWTFEFFPNNAFQRMEGVVDGSYEINHDQLFLTYTDDIWMPDTFTYIFSENNTTLTIMQKSPDLNVILYKQ